MKVLIKEGDKVSKGDTLVVLEVMKMENEIKAPSDGVVAQVPVSTGTQVKAGQLLVKLK